MFDAHRCGEAPTCVSQSADRDLTAHGGDGTNPCGELTWMRSRRPCDSSIRGASYVGPWAALHDGHSCRWVKDVASAVETSRRPKAHPTLRFSLRGRRNRWDIHPGPRVHRLRVTKEKPLLPKPA